MDKKQAVEIAEKFAEVVIDKFAADVHKVVLYGSYARDTMTEWSDIDIAVIVDSVKDDYWAANVKLFDLALDVDDRIEPNLLFNKEDITDFLPNVLRTGKIVYDATKRVH